MTQLGEVATIVDCEHKTAPIDPEGEFYAIGTPAMRGNAINYAEARRISRATFKSWTKRLAPRHGDLLFAREAPVGPVVRIPSQLNVAPGQRTVLIRPHDQKIDDGYLFYLLTSETVQSRVTGLAAGSTVPHLNVADVRVLELGSLPLISEQKAIAEVLGALDDKISANRRLSEAGQAWLRAQWEALCADTSRRVTLEEVVEIAPKVSTSKAAEPPYLDMKNLPEHGLLVERWGQRAARGGARFVNGDTLMARITPCFENGKVALVDFLESGEIGYGSTEYIVLRARQGVPEILPYLIATDRSFRAFAALRRTGTSGRQRVQAAELGVYELNLPSEEAMNSFGRSAAALVERLGTARDENVRLAGVRDELLPLLMSGRVRVRDVADAGNLDDVAEVVAEARA